MLYLAAVDKGTFRRPCIQLLAKQVSDRSWVAVGEETLPIEDSSNISAGMLVLVEVNSNRQVQKLREASREIVGTLQAFSRILEKNKGQEEEIEQWKQSLTFQSQELNRREVELETREDELQQISEQYKQYESDLEGLKVQRTEIETLERNLSEQQQAIGEQRRQLNEQQQQLDSRLEELKQSEQKMQELESQVMSSQLDPAEAEKLLSLSQTLTQSLQLDDSSLNLTIQEFKQKFGEQIQTLDANATTLEPERQRIEGEKQQLEANLDSWLQQHEKWIALQQSIIEVKVEISSLEAAIALGEERLSKLREQVQKQDGALRCGHQLLATRSDVIVAEGFDGVDAASQLDPAELEATVNSLWQKYERHSKLVEQQVSELEQNRQKLEELQQKLESADSNDRFDVEMDIDYAKSACTTLEDSLAPQQRALEKMQAQLAEKEGLLKRLRGEEDTPTVPKVDIAPLLGQLDSYRQWLDAEQQVLGGDLDGKRVALQQQQADLEQKIQQSEALKQELENVRKNLWQQCQNISAALGTNASQQKQLQVIKALLSNLQSMLEPLEHRVTEYKDGAKESRQHVEALHAAVSELLSSARSSAPAEVYA